MLHKAWNSKEEMPYCFPRSSIKFQGHTGQNITDFDPNWAFPDYRPVAAFKSLRFALLNSFLLLCSYDATSNTLWVTDEIMENFIWILIIWHFEMKLYVNSQYVLFFTHSTKHVFQYACCRLRKCWMQIAKIMPIAALISFHNAGLKDLTHWGWVMHMR